jgi:hypothetical protein
MGMRKNHSHSLLHLENAQDAIKQSISSLGLGHNLLSFVQHLRHPLEIAYHLPRLPNEQQLLRVRRQAEIRWGLTFRQLIDPGHKVLPASGTRQCQALAMFGILDDLEPIFERRRCHAVVDEGCEDAPIALVVDLAAVHLCDEGAQHFPWDLGGRDVGAAEGDRVDPCIDDEATAFVLKVC